MNAKQIAFNQPLGLSPYVPINNDVYALAFQGAQSGLADFALGTVSTSYDSYSTLAQTWAQSFDVAWNSAVNLNEVQAVGILDGSYKFWLNTNAELLIGQTTTTLTPLTTPIIASITSSLANFTAKSIIPPVWGGSQGNFTTVIVSFVQPASTFSVSVTVGATFWMAVGEILFIATGGYYSVTSITSPTVVVLTNVGYAGNATPSTTVNAGSQVTPSGQQGPPGAVSGLTPAEILFGSSGGAIQQSSKLTWTDSFASLLLSNGSPTPTIQSNGAATGNSLNIQSGNGSAGGGGTLAIEAGNGTTAGGAVNIESGSATVAAGVGGSIGVFAGGGLTTGSGGSVGLFGGPGGAAGTGGSVRISAGNGGTSNLNGNIALFDGSGNQTFKVYNGTNLLDAPLIGDSATNNPLCFGVATVTLAPTTTLTNVQYNNYCIRLIGSVALTTYTIVFPDIAGGYTKQLDLSQLTGFLYQVQTITIKAGTGSPSTKSVTLYGPFAAGVYTVNYDGTTISCSPSFTSKVAIAATTTVTLAGLYANVISAGIQVGASGTIIGFYSGTVISASAALGLSMQFVLDGSVVLNSVLEVEMIDSFSPLTMPLYQTYGFGSLTPGSAHVIAMQIYSPGSQMKLNNLTLLSP